MHSHILQAFWCACSVLIPLHRCSPKFTTFARSANVPVGIDDPTPAEAHLSVPIFEKMILFVGGVLETLCAGDERGDWQSGIQWSWHVFCWGERK